MAMDRKPSLGHADSNLDMTMSRRLRLLRFLFSGGMVAMFQIHFNCVADALTALLCVVRARLGGETLMHLAPGALVSVAVAV